MNVRVEINIKNDRGTKIQLMTVSVLFLESDRSLKPLLMVASLVCIILIVAVQKRNLWGRIQ